MTSSEPEPGEEARTTEAAATIDLTEYGHGYVPTYDVKGLPSDLEAEVDVIMMQTVEQTGF